MSTSLRTSFAVRITATVLYRTLYHLIEVAGAIDERDKPLARVVRAGAVVADRYSFQPFYLLFRNIRRTKVGLKNTRRTNIVVS